MEKNGHQKLSKDLHPESFEHTPKITRNLFSAKTFVFGFLMLINVAITICLVVSIDKYVNHDKSGDNLSLNKSDLNEQKQKAIIYSVHSNNQQSDECGVLDSKLSRMTLGEGNVEQASAYGEHNVDIYYDVIYNKVLVATEPNCLGDDLPALWYSEDSGKTYTNILSNNTALSSDELSKGTISGVVFSKDGKLAVFTFLSDDKSNDTIAIQIDLETKETKRLFTTIERGTNLIGFDQENQKVYYYAHKPCSDCKFMVTNILYQHNILSDSEEMLFDGSDYMMTSELLRQDLSGLVYVKSVTDNSGKISSVELNEFNFKTRTETTLTNLKNNAGVILAFRSNDGAICYSQNNEAYALDEKGQSNLLFTTKNTITGLRYIDSEQAIVDTAVDNFQDLLYSKLWKIDLKSNETAELLVLDASVNFIGIVSK